MDKNIEQYFYFFKYSVLAYIEQDIKKKYNVKKTKFMVEGSLFEGLNTVVDWADFQTGSGWWINYKHIKDDIFELKAYFPHPPEDVCNKLLDNLFNGVNKYHENVYYKIAGIIYNEKQARKEVMYYLRIGYENIYYDKPKFDNKGRFVCKFDFFCPGSEEYRSLEKGYLILEEK